MKTLLVTGGAGFIGSCFVRMALRNEATRVIVLDKLTYAGNLDSLPQDNSRLVFVKGDIADGPLVLQLLTDYSPLGIINFAAESHVDRSIDGPIDFVQTNVLGTCGLLEAALRHWQTLSVAESLRFRFLHISTDEVYGSLGQSGKFSETSAYHPSSPYSASKAAADHLVRAYHHTYGLPTLITNCSNNYGPYQFPEKLIPLMILNAFEGKALPVYGDGQHVRDWLYVEDHCRALFLVLERGRIGETYNIGGGNEKTNLEVVRAICEQVDALRANPSSASASALITFVADRPGHDRRYAMDTTKIQAELGWSPSESFESGLCATVHWYRENERWVKRVLSGAYRRERLGLGKRRAEDTK